MDRGRPTSVPCGDSAVFPYPSDGSPGGQELSGNDLGTGGVGTRPGGS